MRFSLPKVILHADPIYPPLARQTGIDGDGRVEGARVWATNSHPFLELTAKRAMVWSFNFTSQASNLFAHISSG